MAALRSRICSRSMGMRVVRASGLMHNLSSQERPAMPGDYQIFVRRYDPGGRLTFCFGNLRSAPEIADWIDFKAEPCRLLTNVLADHYGVLTNSRGEDERIDPPKCGRERPQFPADAVNEQIDGFSGVRIAAGEQGSHVVA